MPTFLHTADIHLDSAFSARFDAECAAQRRHELIRVVSDMADIAKELDIWLIAGDLFDGKNVSAETVAFLKRRFSEMPDTQIFIAAGNHDAFGENSVYAREDFGNNVHILSTSGECIELPKLNTRIFGASFSDTFCRERLNAPVIEKQEGVFDILLLHADLVANGGESSYNPIDKSFIEDCGADYLALGHIHKRSEPSKSGKTVYAYPGVPEGRGFDECGDMGCYIGSFDDGVLNLEFRRVCRRRMLIVDADISGVEDNLGAAEVVKEAIRNSGEAGDIFRIILKGRVKSGTINKEIVKNELSDEVYYIELKDETEDDINLEELAMRSDLCGEFVRYMQKKAENADEGEKLLYNQALKLGIEALLGGDGQ